MVESQRRGRRPAASAGGAAGPGGAGRDRAPARRLALRCRGRGRLRRRARARPGRRRPRAGASAWSCSTASSPGAAGVRAPPARPVARARSRLDHARGRPRAWRDLRRSRADRAPRQGPGAVRRDHAGRRRHRRLVTAERPPPPAWPRRLRVLVAEDHDVNQMVVRDLLQVDGTRRRRRVGRRSSRGRRSSPRPTTSSSWTARCPCSTASKPRAASGCAQAATAHRSTRRGSSRSPPTPPPRTVRRAWPPAWMPT